MPSQPNLAHLASNVESLLEKYRDSASNAKFPVDIDKLAELAGVRDIRSISMIPEGVLNVAPEGFIIYLQDNFLNFPSAVFRRRFTIAHEICHTFFYENLPGQRLRRKRIKTDELEVLCNRGAGWLLVPSHWMQTKIQKSGKITAIEHLSKLCKDAAVSMEVLLRRVHEQATAWVECDHSFVLVRRDENGRTVRGVCFGPWLAGQFPAPSLWEPEATWLRRAGDRLQTSPIGDQTFDGPIGRVLLTQSEVTSKDRIYRLRLEKDGGDQ